VICLRRPTILLLMRVFVAPGSVSGGSLAMKGGLHIETYRSMEGIEVSNRKELYVIMLLSGTNISFSLLNCYVYISSI
jgi:hypothetical protein